MIESEVLRIMHINGLIVSNLICDGITHRVATVDKQRQRNGWYLLSTDGNEVWGSCGSFHNGFRLSINISDGYKMDESAIEKMRKISQDNEKRKILEAEFAAKRAQHVWGLLPLNGNSDYVIRKKIIPYGARYGTQDTIAIPMIDDNGVIRALQIIYSEKNVWMHNAPDRRFWPRGCSKKGCFFEILATSRLAELLPMFITEGYATACSVFMASILDTVVAFDAGNIIEVARIFRKKFPKREIFICADDDHVNQENIGVIKANEAALKYNCSVIIPKFYNDRTKTKEATDFNDVLCMYGVEEVRRQILGDIR